jgi:Sulfotransferase domain
MRGRELFTRFKAYRRKVERESANNELANEDKSAERERLKRLRRQLRQKDRELEKLRAQLSGTQNVAPRPLASLEDTPVFFLVGRAKSGTSWLMMMLDAHPEILCKGEGRFFGRNFIQKDFVRGQKGRIQPSSLYRALLEAEYLEGWIERSVWTRGDNVEEHLNNLTRLSANYFLAQRLAKSGKRIVGDKAPFLKDNDIVQEIGKIYPGARVIHIIRDGRDVAVSLLHHRWNHSKDEGGIYELKPEELAKRQAFRENPKRLVETGDGVFPKGMLRNVATGWRDQVSKCMRDDRSLLGADYAEVKYEDLQMRPTEEIRRLLAFLGAEAGEETARRCVSAASFEKLAQGRERGQEDPSSFFRKGVVGDWKNVFTDKDKQLFKEEAGDLLIELGYEKDDDW